MSTNVCSPKEAEKRLLSQVPTCKFPTIRTTVRWAFIVTKPSNHGTHRYSHRCRRPGIEYPFRACRRVSDRADLLTSVVLPPEIKLQVSARLSGGHSAG